MKKSITFLVIGIFLLSALTVLGSNSTVDILSVRGKPDKPPGKPDKPDPEPDPDPGTGDGIINKYALVIGISDYDSPENDLEYCDEDADDWANYFDGEGYTVNKLINPNFNQIANGLFWILDSHDADDWLAITYSGHGIYVGQYRCSAWISSDEYLVLQTDIKTSITDNFVSTHVFMFLDCCNAGTFSKCVSTGWVAGIGSAKNTYTYDGNSDMQNGYYTWMAMYAIDTEGYIYAEDICEFAEVNFEYYTPGRASTVDQYSGMMDI